MKPTRFIGALASCLMVGAIAAKAEETGKSEFETACASCHGVEAKGDGPLAQYLSVPVPALTGLSAANDGIFPMLKVIHTIDGRQQVQGHGDPMPAWGLRFQRQAEVENYGPYGGETVVRGRLLSIAYYLESIQE